MHPPPSRGRVRVGVNVRNLGLLPLTLLDRIIDSAFMSRRFPSNRVNPLPPREGKLLIGTFKMSEENPLRWACRKLSGKDGGSKSFLPSWEMLGKWQALKIE